MKLLQGGIFLGFLVLNVAAVFHPRQPIAAPFLAASVAGGTSHEAAVISQLQHKDLQKLVPPKDVKTVVHLKQKNNPVYLNGSPLAKDKLDPHGEGEGHHDGHEGIITEGHHEGHEGHHEGHEEAHEAEHDVNQAESFAIATFLMGSVGALMFVFYLVNNRSRGIRLSTWRVLNMTVSIFVAVLLYSSLKMFILHTFEPSFLVTVYITLSLFFIFYAGTTAILYYLKGGQKQQLEAAATILAHITGFAAMYGFADTREVKFFEERGATGILLLIVVAAAVIGLLSTVCDFAMKKIASRDDQVDESEETWMEQCDEADDDVFCLAISFLFVILYRTLIRGKAQPYEPGKVGNVTQSDATALLAFALGSLVLVGVGAVLIIKFNEKLSRNKRIKRVVSVLQQMNSMVAAWCFLFWAEWQLYVLGWESTVIGGCVVVAFFLTAASFACVFLLNAISERLQSNKLGSRALESVELALGVLVGFSWERAFDVGFEVVEHTAKHGSNSVPAPVVVALMSLLLLIIVAPAWRYYILPKVDELEESAPPEKSRSFQASSFTQ